MAGPANRLEALAPAAVLAVSAASLGFAFTAEYAFGLEPCVLCLYQRIPYAAAAVFAALGLAAGPGLPRRIAVGLAAVAFAVGAAIAFYHVGVERHWWASAASCGGGLAEVEAGQALLQALTEKPEKACDEVDWTLFGISMATYNVFYSAGLAALSAWAWRKMRKDAA